MKSVIRLADWVFSVDIKATSERTQRYSLDHCTCPYCQNYYETLEQTHPALGPVLGKFGIDLNGPSELMPLEPTLFMACYRVTGQILEQGRARLHIDGIPFRPEKADDETFFLWIGELALPWVQDIPQEDVISPANQPEFLERMEQKWLQLQMDEDVFA